MNTATEAQSSPKSQPARDLPCKHLGLFAGEGELPLHIVKKALSWGLPITTYTNEGKTYKALVELLGKERVRKISIGQLDRNYKLIKSDGVDALTCAGKVNKWVFLKNLNMDKRALGIFRRIVERSDDQIMLHLIEDVESEGFKVLPQKLFLDELLIAPGLYSHRQPSDEESRDIEMGLQTACEIARLDIGQSAVVSNRMVIALEAIEGTDQMIERCGKFLKKNGGVLAKVEKPNQDERFDIPTVGPRTLHAMKKAGLHILAIEAKKTLVLDLDDLVRQANKWKMIVIAHEIER